MQEEKDMTLDEAEARHEEVMLEMAGIKAQIAAAKAHVHTTGEYADAGWFAKASSALLTDTLFAPRPGPYCRWCHFRKENGGPCTF